jgi:hypothetical protein
MLLHLEVKRVEWREGGMGEAKGETKRNGRLANVRSLL